MLQKDVSDNSKITSINMIKLNKSSKDRVRKERTKRSYAA